MKTEKCKPILYSLYCASLMAMNILAAKQIDVFCFTVTCGIFTSGFVFVAQDLTTELFGKSESKKMLFSSYCICLAMTVLYQIAIFVPCSKYWGLQTEFSSVLRTTFRTTIASFVAYSAGSFTNVTVMAKLKKSFPKSLFVRAVTSTLLGQFLDNGIFALIAFYGVLPITAIAKMTIGGTIIEALTEIIMLPLLKYLVKKLEA